MAEKRQHVASRRASDAMKFEVPGSLERMTQPRGKAAKSFIGCVEVEMV